jgi:hypothetical protein
MSRPEVFLSHASADKPSVKAIALQLQQRAVPTWLDEWNLVPGQPWVDALGQALRECSGCVVFLGPGGTGPWHHEEVRSALDLAARDASYRLVPVLLPGAKPERMSQLPGFLANRTWVDFAKGLDDAEALHRLVCGIQGKEPGPPGGASYEPGRRQQHLGGSARRRPMRTLAVMIAMLFLATGTAFLWPPPPAAMAPDRLEPPAPSPKPSSPVAPPESSLSPVKSRSPSSTAAPYPKPPVPLVRLQVTCEPPGTITLRSSDQTLTRPSPLTVSLRPGRVDLEATGSGKQAFHIRDSFVLLLSPTQQTHTLLAQTGRVVFRSRPSSLVTVDGVQQLDVPGELTLYEGEHTASFECDPRFADCSGKARVTISFPVKPGFNPPVEQIWE